MHFRVILRILGILLMIFSITQLPPLGVSLFYADETHWAFISAFAITLATGFMI